MPIARVSEVRLSEIIAALSHALDLTEGRPPGHAERTCALGMRLATDIDLPVEQRSALFYALLLKDAGCSSSSARMAMLFGTDDIELKRLGKVVDWQRPVEALRFTAATVALGEPRLVRARRFLQVVPPLKSEAGEIVGARCDRGAQIVLRLAFPAESASAVRSLDEQWNGKGQPDGLAGEAIPELARIASLAQAAEVFFVRDGVAAARKMVERRRGSWFEPRIADAFLAIADDDPLWAELAADEVDLDSIGAGSDEILHADDARIDDVALAFADVIDAKSEWTAQHSVSVARYAVALGGQFGFSHDRLRDLRRMGLLHDIGKLAIPNTVLDKRGRLSEDEFAVIRRHPAHTEEILSRVEMFAPLAGIAAAHHERIDGRGYHRGIAIGELPLDARVLATADVFDALSSARPYRDQMPTADALAIMREDVGSHPARSHSPRSNTRWPTGCSRYRWPPSCASSVHPFNLVMHGRSFARLINAR